MRDNITSININSNYYYLGHIMHLVCFGSSRYWCRAAADLVDKTTATTTTRIGSSEPIGLGADLPFLYPSA